MTHDELLADIARLEDYGKAGYTPAAFAALRAVVELHKPFFGLCQICKDAEDEYSFEYIGVSYPCPTIQAIDKALS